MTISASDVNAPIGHTDRFFIGGRWVAPSSDAMIKVIDSHTERVYLTVAEAQAADIGRAVSAARAAFDSGPWPRLTHAERAGYPSPRPSCWTARQPGTALRACEPGPAGPGPAQRGFVVSMRLQIRLTQRGALTR